MEKQEKVLKKIKHANNCGQTTPLGTKPNDECYTSLQDILNEMCYWADKGKFRGKNIICPCDWDIIKGQDIYSITFNKKIDKKLEISFIGTGFYRYMIRNLVGALIEVGKYKISKETLNDMLDTIENKKSLPTAPPEGLYLSKVWYK